MKNYQKYGIIEDKYAIVEGAKEKIWIYLNI